MNISKQKPPETTDEFFALPIRNTIEAIYEPGPNGTTVVRPRVYKACAFTVTPDTVFMGHDAEGHVFVLGMDEQGFCRRPWR